MVAYLRNVTWSVFSFSNSPMSDRHELQHLDVVDGARVVRVILGESGFGIGNLGLGLLEYCAVAHSDMVKPRDAAFSVWANQTLGATNTRKRANGSLHLPANRKRANRISSAHWVAPLRVGGNGTPYVTISPPRASQGTPGTTLDLASWLEGKDCKVVVVFTKFLARNI